MHQFTANVFNWIIQLEFRNTVEYNLIVNNDKSPRLPSQMIFFFLEMNDFRNQFSCDLLDIGGLCLVHLFTGKFQCSMR